MICSLDLGSYGHSFGHSFRRNPKIGTVVLAHRIACVANRRLETQDSLQVSRAAAQVTNQVLGLGSLLEAQMLL